MSTMTGNLRRTMLLGAVGALVLAGAATVVRADVASDKPGAILIYPKIVVDTGGVLGPATDTEIQLTNTSNISPGVAAKCFFVNFTSYCSNSPTGTRVACTAALAAQTDPVLGLGQGGCGGSGVCVPPCSPSAAAPLGTVDERDFRVSLTKRQPISWKASSGRQVPPTTFACSGGSNPGTACHGTTDTTTCTGGSCVGIPTGTFNPPVTQSDPFIGELKCIEIDPNNTDTSVPVHGNNPANNLAGDLKGEATIVSVSSSPGLVDARKYSAIGLQATGFNDLIPTTLQVGGPNAEYNGCPKVITLNNVFDDAPVTTHNVAGSGITHTVRTDLTVVPCSEDLSGQTPTTATLQFLVFNEFEQRFSTSTGFSCFKEVGLSDIGGPAGPSGDPQSIFNFGVEGTLTGQTRIRPVASGTSDRRVLAITEEFWTTDATKHSAAANTFFIPSGTAASDLGDTIFIPDN